MIEILIDADMDRVTITQGGSTPIEFKKVRSPYELRQILEEILNMLDPIEVRLVYQDEGEQRTIGEW